MSGIDQQISDIKRLADLLEKHPGAPLTDEERAAIKRSMLFFRRMDALVWFFGWGKWAVGALVLIAVNWGRISGAWDGWTGRA